MTVPLLSVVVPTWNEAGTLEGLLADLGRLDVPHEVVVVDGGSTDGTVAVGLGLGATVVTSARGRGRQLRAGAAAASGPYLCFLHADVRLPDDTLRVLALLARACRPGACAFQLAIDSPRWSYRVVEFGSRLRSTLLALPYGDQGLAIARETYERVGGFDDVPLMEDVRIARALTRVGGIALHHETVVVSARRWERDGVWRRTFANGVLLARYLAGASPESLVRRYASADAHTPD